MYYKLVYLRIKWLIDLIQDYNAGVDLNFYIDGDLTNITKNEYIFHA